MPNISREKIEQQIALLNDYFVICTPDRDLSIGAALAMLQGLLDQPTITKMTIPPPQAEMIDVVYAEGWNAACDAYFGGLPPQEPLIVTFKNSAHSAPFTPITADMVTDEMVDAYIRQRHSFKDHEVVIATAVNTYMGAKK
jgi:hypothetical protein